MIKALRCRVATPRMATLAMLLALAGGARAGSPMLAAPVKAQLSASPSVGGAGVEVTARLRLIFLEDLAGVKLRLSSQACMSPVGDAPLAWLRTEKKGSTITVAARFRIHQETPCDVYAEVITYEDQSNRFGSVFGVTVNPKRLGVK